jgi:hypothetical protein
MSGYRSDPGASGADEREHPEPIEAEEQSPAEDRPERAQPMAAGEGDDVARSEQPSAAMPSSAGDPGSPSGRLLPEAETEQFRSRWQEVQTGFVDRPQEMVEKADDLVADLTARLSEQFTQERSRLESQWDADGDVSTEDLRVALTRYRSFFERLLAA